MVVVVALAACAAGIRNQLVQDDVILISQNVRIHDLANWREIVSSPFWPPPYSQDLYRPLTALLLALEWAMGQGAPVVFRLASYACYAAASVAVLSLARRLLPIPIALGAALLFAAHPVHVEAVALGVGQNELLVAVCCCIAVGHYLTRRRSGNGSLRVGDWMLLAGLYLAASLLKEGGLILPGLLLAAELLLLQGLPSRRRQLAGGYALLFGIAVLVVLLRAMVFPGHLAGTFTADALTGLSIGDRALTMLRVVPEWVRLLVFPAHLQADYSPQEIVASTGFGFTEAAGLLILVVAVVAVWLIRLRAPVLSFGLAWTAIALLPVSNVVVPTGIVLAERTLFLPSLGMLIAAGGLLAALAKPVLEAEKRTTFWSVVALLVLAGVLRSVERQRVWRDETTLRIRSVADAPRSWRTQLSYGTALFEAEQPGPALEAYQRSLELAPANLIWRVRNDLANRYFERGQDREAVAELEASVAAAPGVEETRSTLVLGYLTLGEYLKARAAADSAIALGFSLQTFSELRALADTAEQKRLPPGSIKVRVRR